MLKEIYSPMFKEHGKNGTTRPAIKFHEGLNVILGEQNGYNSIGKSTALLAIDFAFGGNSYLSSTGLKRQYVADHFIFSTFEFDGKEYRFGRSTDDPDTIHICEKGYKLSKETWEKTKFVDWLKDMYHLDFPGLSFRDVLSSFFRIYGKDNLDERHPLTGVRGDSMEKSIHRLVVLFNRYGDVEQLQKKLNDQKEKLSVFKKARSYQYIPNMVGGNKQYEANLAEIDRLQQELDTLQSGQEETRSNEDIEKGKQKSALQDAIFHIEEQIAEKQRRLRLINTSIEYGLYPTEADLNSLQEFFPGVNVKKIYEVENYHKKLATILDGQFNDEKKSVEEEIDALKAQADALREQMNELGIVGNFSKEFLDKHSELKGRIDLLKRQNDAYLTEKDLQDVKKRANDNLQREIHGILGDIEHKIDDHMQKDNDRIFSSHPTPPVLQLNAYNSYSFETPGDGGAGTNYRGLILYDVAVLALTNLPAIAHDTNLYGDVWSKSIDEIIKIYTETKKQIFIAFDKQANYTPETQKIVDDNAVLRLSSDGMELYGWSWNKEEPQE